MESLVFATAAFLVTHFVSSTPLRAAAVRRIGEWPWRGLYSVAAFATLGWMIWAYAQAPREALLWTPLRHLPSLLVPLAFVLLACGYLGNPTAVGQEKLLGRREPARGIIRVTRHPVMWAVILWSLAHIAARADAKSIVFFGGFLVLAAAGTVLIDKKNEQRPEWAPFAAATSNLPFLAIAQGRNRMAWREIGWIRPLAGLALFGTFFGLHPWLFGARPY